MSWGLGSGAWFLLIGGIVIIIAGILEKMANTQFFATKVTIPGKEANAVETPKQTSQSQTPITEKKKKQKKGKRKENFCSQCGSKLEEGATFCINCGKNLGK